MAKTNCLKLKHLLARLTKLVIDVPQSLEYEWVTLDCTESESSFDEIHFKPAEGGPSVLVITNSGRV